MSCPVFLFVTWKTKLKKVLTLEEITCSALVLSVIIEFIKVFIFLGISGFVVTSFIPNQMGILFILSHISIIYQGLVPTI